MTTQYIPNKLRKYRTLKGIRQCDLAVELGLKSTDRISRWEKGLTYPHVINLFKLAKIYGVSAEELYSAE